MSERKYKVEIVDSTKELTKRQKVALKNFADMKQLDEVVSREEGLLIDIDYVVTVSVHNEKAKENPDYLKYIYVDRDGMCYISGSEPLHNQFMDIYEDMVDEMEDETEPWSIKVIKKPSANYNGRDFLTCVLV